MNGISNHFSDALTVSNLSILVTYVQLNDKFCHLQLTKFGSLHAYKANYWSVSWHEYCLK